MTSVIARIALRYVAGVLIAKGIVDAGFGNEIATDAELIGYLQIGLGTAAATVSEWWYHLARKFGWSK